MVRVVVGPSGRLAIDRKAPGRGAWLCRLGEAELAKPECIAKAAKRRAFARALRAPIEGDDVGALFAMACERARMDTSDRAVPDGHAGADRERD